MNILIVGNGFDLSHYLPTKYDHFMDVMEAIEAKDLNKPLHDIYYSPFNRPSHLISKYFEIVRLFNEKTYQMNFNDLFLNCRDNNFISKTKEMYNTENVILSTSKILEIQELLEKNSWYHYFKNHVKEIKTWIDFESKIKDGLEAVSKFIYEINKKIQEKGHFSYYIQYLGESDGYEIFLTKECCKILEKLNFLSCGYYQDFDKFDEYGRQYVDTVETGNDINGTYKFCINENIISDYSEYKKINSDFLLSHLQNNLDDFVKIFNIYLEVIVDELVTRYPITIVDNNWKIPDKIYSFNYTNSFLKFYKLVPLEFLHGNIGDDQNIVLGVSDLNNDLLVEMKAYGFTKYHQKLFKDTDYLFLDEYKKKIFDDKSYIDDLKRQGMMSLESAQIRVLQAKINVQQESQSLDLNFYIWGHSLDISDQDYIQDLFSLNDEIDRNVRVTVYYFDKSAKFALLNNLLSILEKDKVEHWMKNKWLIFEPNPEIRFTDDVPLAGN